MREPTPDAGPPLDPTRFVRLGLLFYGALAVAAVVWRQGAYGEAVWEAPGVGAPPQDLWLVGVLGGLALGTAAVVASFAVTEWTAWGERLARSLARQLPPLSLPDAVLLAFASGLAEEMFFRGALQPRVGLVWASLLFGLLHLPAERALVPWSLPSSRTRSSMR